MSDRCLVRWRMESPSGGTARKAVTIEPLTAGTVVWRGRLVVLERVRVLPDDQGNCQVELVPSSAAGAYSVRLPGTEPQTLIVPDKRAATLFDCLGEPEAPEEGEPQDGQES